jgi:hypothetical protein
VVVDHQRQGRKVIAIKFKMTRMRLLPEATLEQKTLFPEMETIPTVMRELRDAGMSMKDAQEIWGQGFGYVDEDVRPTPLDGDAEAALLQYIREKIHLLKRKQASGTIENSTGFLLQAIRQNYANPEFADELRREASAARQKAIHEQEKLVKALELQKATLEKVRDGKLEQLHALVAAAVPDLLEQAAATLLAEDNGFRFVYKRERSALDNYQSRPSLQVFFHPYLERQDPARFEAIKQHYAVQIAAVDAQIATIGG